MSDTDRAGDRQGLPSISFHTLIDVLHCRADETPQRTAYVMLADGETEVNRITYGDLWRAVCAWAAAIDARTPPRARVLLLLPTGINFVAAFLGCLAAQRIAVPAYPPPPSRASRIRAIAADAEPALIVAPARSLDATRRALDGVAAIAGSGWIGDDDAALVRADGWSPLTLDAERTAFLQYTSGSTAAPRGVRVTHANLMHNEECIRVAFRLSSATTVVSWLPLFHDMGLVGTLLQPLYVGALGVLLPAAAFLQKPVRWLRAVTTYRAFCSGGPNFAYDLCTRKITRQESAGLDLSSWSVAFNGAEPIRAATLEAFAARFADQGFRMDAFLPCYGLAEATLLVSSRQGPAVRQARGAALERGRYEDAGAGDAARPLVSCGPSYAGDLRIVDPETHGEVEHTAVGEIWLAGGSITKGYWRQPEATAEDFAARLVPTGEGPFLRTGDLGLLIDGDLFITGRLKDLIILRGANHYPQDIELTVGGSHPALSGGRGAAFSADVDGSGEEQLVVVHEVERESLRRLDVTAIGDAAREAVVREHGLALAVLVLVRPGGVPKTSSGKLQRHQCRRAFLEQSLPVVAESRSLGQTAGTWASLEAIAALDSTREVLRQADRVLTMGELLHEVDLAAAALAGDGGDPPDVMVEPSCDALVAVLARWRQSAALVLRDRTGRRVLRAGPQQVRDHVRSFAGKVRDSRVLVCALRDPDPAAALDWIAALLQGGRIVFSSPAEGRTAAPRRAGFSLLYFSASDAEFVEDKYRLYLESARFADRHGFEAVWTPERHFHAFGGLYPNPSVLSAALAMTTDRIRLRAGSVVLPLHHPARVVEEWAVVDNLSRGRVDLAFARGWNANDFVFAPEHFACSADVLFRNLEVVRRLWRGEAITLRNGQEQPVDVRVHPLPQQKELNVWITCSGGAARFAEAGTAGANVLTALLFQPIEELATKIALYRQARAERGHDPHGGCVTLMLHTFIGADADSVRRTVRDPFIEYLRTSVDLWRHGSKALDEVPEHERRQLLEFAFERYFHTSALFGTPSALLDRIDELLACGVDEIACLIDFGVPVETALSSLDYLDELRRRVQSETPPAEPGERLAARLEALDGTVLQCTAEQARAVAARRPGVSCLVPGDVAVPGAPATSAPDRSDALLRRADRELLRWLHELARQRIAEVLEVSPRQVALDQSFSQLGIDSLKGVEIIGRLSDELGVELSPTLLFEFPTLAKLGEHLVHAHAPVVRARRAARQRVATAAAAALS